MAARYIGFLISAIQGIVPIGIDTFSLLELFLLENTSSKYCVTYKENAFLLWVFIDLSSFNKKVPINYINLYIQCMLLVYIWLNTIPMMHEQPSAYILNLINRYVLETDHSLFWLLILNVDRTSEITKDLTCTGPKVKIYLLFHSCKSHVWDLPNWKFSYYFWWYNSFNSWFIKSSFNPMDRETRITPQM